MFKNPFSFYGRIRRTEYGLSLIIYALLVTIINVIITESSGGAGILGLGYIPMIWFLLAQGAKRCHDLSNSGWFQLIPFYGFWLLFQDGQLGENEYGENPKGVGVNNYVYNQKTDNISNQIEENEENFISDNPNLENDVKPNYFISHFGNFGKDKKIKQFDFSSNDSEFEEVNSFCLNEDSIKIFPNTHIYYIKRKIGDKQHIVSYSICSSVINNAIDNDLFYGSSIHFVDKIAEEYIIVNNLNELHNSFFKNNLNGANVDVYDSNDLKINKPKYFDNIQLYLKNADVLTNNEQTNKSLVVYCKINPDNIQKMFKQSLNLLNFYETIYFTESYQIAEYVLKKNVFEVIDNKKFEETINQLNN